MSKTAFMFLDLSRNITADTGVYDPIDTIVVSDKLFDIIYLECLADMVYQGFTFENPETITVYNIKFAKQSYINKLENMMNSIKNLTKDV